MLCSMLYYQLGSNNRSKTISFSRVLLISRRTLDFFKHFSEALALSRRLFTDSSSHIELGENGRDAEERQIFLENYYLLTKETDTRKKASAKTLGKRYGNVTKCFLRGNVTETRNPGIFSIFAFPVNGNVTETPDYMFPLSFRDADMPDFAL